MRDVIDKVLDRAERSPLHIPVSAATLGFGIGHALQAQPWGFGFIGAGLFLVSVRPVGTWLRRRIMIRQVQNLVDELVDEQEERGETQ